MVVKDIVDTLWAFVLLGKWLCL